MFPYESDNGLFKTTAMALIKRTHQEKNDDDSVNGLRLSTNSLTSVHEFAQFISDKFHLGNGFFPSFEQEMAQVIETKTLPQTITPLTTTFARHSPRVLRQIGLWMMRVLDVMETDGGDYIFVHAWSLLHVVVMGRVHVANKFDCLKLVALACIVVSSKVLGTAFEISHYVNSVELSPYVNTKTLRQTEVSVLQLCKWKFPHEKLPQLYVNFLVAYVSSKLKRQNEADYIANFNNVKEMLTMTILAFVTCCRNPHQISVLRVTILCMRDICLHLPDVDGVVLDRIASVVIMSCIDRVSREEQVILDTVRQYSTCGKTTAFNGAVDDAAAAVVVVP